MDKYKTMKYYLDTEFHEYKKHSKALGFNVGEGVDTIDLISIGIVCDDGREYYAISNEFDLDAATANDWLRENVLTSMVWDMFHKKHKGIGTSEITEISKEETISLIKEYGKSREQIGKDIIEFTAPQPTGLMLMCDPPKQQMDKSPIEFYGYYADYDWVVFCWLFGRMIDLPGSFPMYCRDLQQIKDDKKVSSHDKGYPEQDNEHNALDDAKWNKALHKFLDEV